MARRHEAEGHLRDGHYAHEIAEIMGVSGGTVVQYLRTRVGEGALRLSDLYFSWPADKRQILQEAISVDRKSSEFQSLLEEHCLCWDGVELFEALRSTRMFRGDMYEYICEVELHLHDLVRSTLVEEYGSGEQGWWRQGVPRGIRVKCVQRREEDDEPCIDPFDYTSFIDLSKVMKKQWSTFLSLLPEVYASNRSRLEADLTALNRVRNSVMHPVKDKRWSESDFDFVRLVAGNFRIPLA
jgi:hypothetical protein